MISKKKRGDFTFTIKDERNPKWVVKNFVHRSSSLKNPRLRFQKFPYALLNSEALLSIDIQHEQFYSRFFITFFECEFGFLSSKMNKIKEDFKKDLA